MTEKEQEMLKTRIEERDVGKYGTINMQDVADLMTLHNESMTKVDETNTMLSLNELARIIIDALMLGYSRGKEDQ